MSDSNVGSARPDDWDASRVEAEQAEPVPMAGEVDLAAATVDHVESGGRRSQDVKVIVFRGEATRCVEADDAANGQTGPRDRSATSSSRSAAPWSPPRYMTGT